ncbi:MAG: PadR family transcriptional regulator [Nitrososphaerota archaeon]|nr:PadR family transcriptional regulator [Nitrososphaerota archaeon]
MARTLHRRWLHPQAVPRGFLRLYILAQLTRGPETGYSIMQRIDDRTDGAWKPGPGTMYPLLKGLVSDGLAKTTDERGRKSYEISSKGREELARMRAGLSNIGRRERVIGRLFSDILSPSVMVPAMVTRYKDGFELFRKMAAKLPKQESEVYLKDVRLFMEAQTKWIDSELGDGVSQAPKRATRVRR